MSKLVSVVVPAFNASRTLDETLRSVRSQTHLELEIIVVDDGSFDDTCVIAARHAAADSRVKVVSQNNQGVAAARNCGWRVARSDLIAFVDADDLWAPTKIEQQLAALEAAGDRVGLVYCRSTPINANSEKLPILAEQLICEGDVFDRILACNFVGNGSAALVRRQALVDTAGFDTGLRAAGAEGCEDLLLYARIASRYRFAVVPDFLVGYRRADDSMSSNHLQMLGSWILVLDQLLPEHPDRAASLRLGLRNYFNVHIRHAVSFRKLRLGISLVRLVLRRYPRVVVETVVLDVPKLAVKAVLRLVRRLCSWHGTPPPQLGRFVIGCIRKHTDGRR
jgi:glycosyltransferase involved in cell wall biosynthesis